MPRDDQDSAGGVFPADLEKTNTAAASTAASTSKSSYTKKINLPLVRNKQYKFFFTYKHEDPDTKEIKESDRSPVWIETYAIPNLTKGVLNLTLTQGYKSYGVKFDIDPTSIQEDIVIFESLTSTNIGNVVYIGTSTNVTIPTNSIATRWITVRTRDKWEDLNITDVGPLSVTPLNPDPDTSTPPSGMTTTSATAVIDPNDKSGFGAMPTINWVASTDANTKGYSIRWSTDNPSTVTNPMWEYNNVDGRNTTTFVVTGLTPNTTYYYEVAPKSPYNAIDWANKTSGTFIATDSTADGAWSRLKSYLAIGGATEDLFKIGTQIVQKVNNSINITPTYTSDATVNNGIILNTSTTNVGNNYWLNSGHFRVGNETSFLYWNGSDLYTTGKINATGGSFTGDVKLDGGTLFAGAAANSGQRVRLNSSGIFAYSAQSTGSNFQTFSLDTAGYMNATSGLIGGWTLDATTLSANSVILNSAGQISLGATPSTSVFLSSSDDKRIWVGSQTSNAAKFSVDQNGILRAEGAIIGLGAGSTISGYATTAALGDYTLTSTTTGIATRLTTAESSISTQAGSISTLSTGLSTKNSTFVTADSTAPAPNKLGDLWINGGDNNEIYTAISLSTTPILSRWSKKTNTTYANKTDLNSKLNATSFVVQNSVDNKIAMNTSGVTVYAGDISNEGVASSGITFNSAGISAWKNGSPTFSITSSGDAAFAGNISGSSGTFTGSIAVGTPGEYGSSDFFRTSYTRNGVVGLGVNAISFESLTTAGWTSSNYPYYDDNVDLGVNQFTYTSGLRSGETVGPFRWRNIRMTGFLSIGGNGATNAVSTSGTAGPRTQLQADGNIYANTLGGGTTANFITQQSGYLRVNSSSSRRYKRNIVDIRAIDYLNPELLLNIPVRSFIYTDEHLSTSDQRSGKEIPGFIAEEVEAFYPVAVDYGDDGLPERWNTNMIIPGMLSLIQKQHAEILLLKSRLDALEQ